MPNAGRNHQRKGRVADKAQRQVRAFELSLAGNSLREIAAIMSGEGARISHEGVRSLIELEAAERVSPVAEQYRTLLIERLNALRLKVGELLEVNPAPVTAGKDGGVVRDPEHDNEIVRDYGLQLSTADRLLKIDAQLAKLTGAEAPTESIVNANVTARPAELDGLIAEARAQQQAAEQELMGEAGA
ncbi:hypothetical protein [Amycolatopsis sp. NPDC051371]|uniref:hypothetical protein n=1 Tax=Amycolatopsis sp. NPDC051371 TaxID=3155800 RepID=UPI003440438D